jgi:hypothetical protein
VGIHVFDTDRETQTENEKPLIPGG